MPRYIRFVVAGLDESSGVRAGLLTSAYDKVKDPETPVYIADAMERLIAWFEIHLPLPDRFTTTRSKGWYRRTGTAISWFKPEAATAISKARALAALLETEGVYVTVISTTRPGFVAYEDDQQIVAEPFSDTAT